MGKIEELQEYFDFSEEDLQENRNGNISSDQRIILIGNIQKEMLRYLLLFIMGVVATLIAKSKPSGSDDVNMFGVIILLLGVLGFAIFRYNKRNDFSLQTVEGKVNFIWVRRTGNGVDGMVRRDILKLRVGGKSFEVRGSLSSILQNGDFCRLYYTGGGDIISVELLDHFETS